MYRSREAHRLPRFRLRGRPIQGRRPDLANEQVLEGGAAETIIAAIGFRNVLAHQYGSIDYDVIFEQLDAGLAVFDEFSQQVARWYRT